MKPITFALFGLFSLGAALCSAAVVPLPNGAVRIALIEGDWPSAGNDWARTDETLIDVFYATATDPNAQYTVGTRLQVYNLADNKLSKGIVVPRSSSEESRGPLQFFSKNLPSNLEYEQRIGWSAQPLLSNGPDLQDSTIPYVGPLVSTVVVPEPASLLIWSLLAAGVLLRSVAVTRRRRCR
jgi:hypothetical protein